MRSFVILASCLLLALVAVQQSEAKHLGLKRLVKYGLIANALTGKKILFPLPLPLPIPIFQENVHHTPYPVNHHTHAEIGYGLEHGAGHFGGGYGGGYGGGFGHGGGYGHGGGLGAIGGGGYW